MVAAERVLRERAASLNDAAGWFYLGQAQHRLGKLEQAASSFRRAAELAEAPSEAYCALATVLAAQGKPQEAETVLERSIARHPGHARSHHNLGVLLAQRDDREAALRSYDRALQIDAGLEASRQNRAALRLATGDPAGALEDYEFLCSVGTPSADTRAGRVRALLLLHRDEEALEAAGTLVGEFPDFDFGWRLKATAAASLHRHAEAVAASARMAKPSAVRTLMIGRALDRMDVCDWRDRDFLLHGIRAALDDGGEPELWTTGLLFHALALPLTARELKEMAARVVSDVRPQRKPAATGAQRRNDARIRVGFISPDIRVHPGAHLMLPLFRDRNRAAFEYVLYALNPDDGSEVREALRASADQFVDASGLGDDALLDRMTGDELDILVDASGYFEGTRPQILAARPAPVQVGYLGMACTMGPGFLDYRLCDAICTPRGAEADWFENLAILPTPHWPYDTARMPEDAGARESHGLPTDGFVFCCFNQAFKFCPDAFRLWLRLLRDVPGSVLWLLDPGAVARSNLEQEARGAGVDAQRLCYAPRVPLEKHLGRQRHADLFLDTLHYGAHTTAADALHAGVPVLTCPGETMAARLCASLVTGAGLSELVVESLAAYERKALELATNPKRTDELKVRLKNARSHLPFFQMHDRVRGVERAFRAMVERHRAGLPPAMLDLE